MNRLIVSMLTVVVLVAGCAAQTAPVPTSPEPTQQGATPNQDPTVQAPSTPAPGTPDPRTQTPSTQAPSTQAPTAQAPTAQTPTTTPQGTNQFPAGTIIPAELSKSLDAKKAKAGDKVEAKTPVDLLSQGKIVIPRNTKITGHVINVKAHSKESPDSTVGIVFDRISMKDGHDVPIQATVQAIARPLQSAAPSNNGAADNGGMPGGSAPSGGGGGGMGGYSPSRPSAPAGSYPSGSTAGADPSSSNASTLAPLGPTSQGAVGMKGISLKPSDQGTVISSEKDNVHLDSGTQLILRTQ